MTSSRTPPRAPTRDSEGEEFRQHPRPSGRRILFFSFLASALFHLVILVVYPMIMERGIAERPVAEREAPEIPPDALRVLGLRELPDGEVEEAAAPEETEPLPEAEDPEELEEEADPEVVEPAPAVTPPPAVARPDPEADAPTLTPAERLQPHMVDPRLWREVVPEVELSDEERARIRVLGLMEEWADSISALEEAERRALDWTYTDEEGRRWGISPGRLHLGEYSLPLPIHFGTPAGIRDQVERRAWEWEEIERGAASAAVRDALKDRAQEIRARRNAERADTLGIRR